MKHAIIGTAGHVDHGKTSLIKALTGVNTDRLQEEQERGMTIDIGFASLRLPDGTLAGIVDVPGHERFLKNMLAGASGVDVVLLVIAADESVMPQTREHIDILRLLDVRNGVIALTKTDLVDEEWLRTVEADVREELSDSFLNASPIIRVSCVTGQGIEALKKALMSAVSRAAARNVELPFRIPIDRVFARPGFGTVVTGTLVSGVIATGDNVEAQPGALQCRVRGLQIHGKRVDRAEAGSRVAVNLAGVDRDSLRRGMQITPPGAAVATGMIDTTFRMLPGAPGPLKDHARVRVYLGTGEYLARARILSVNKAMEGGAEEYVQFRCEEPLVALRGDRFVVRSYSPMRTLGGGTVLDERATRHLKGDSAVLRDLDARRSGSPLDLVETVLSQAAYGLHKVEIQKRSGISAAECDEALGRLAADARIREMSSERYISAAQAASLESRVFGALATYHANFPLRAGMPREEMRACLPGIDGRGWSALLDIWQKEHKLTVEGATVRLPTFEVQLNDRQESLLRKIESVYLNAGIAVPEVQDVVREINAPPDAVSALLRAGADKGRLVRIQDGMYYHSEVLVRLKDLVRSHIAANGSISVGELRDLARTNRRWSLAALEYLDSIRYTRREKDTRVLVEP